MRQSSFDHSIFVRHCHTDTIIFAVYVDNFVLSGDDHQGIIQLKAYLSFHFHIKVIGLLRYFLGIEVARSSKDFSLSQRKYLTNLLKKTDIIGSKPINTPMDPNVSFDQKLKKSLADPEK